MPNPVVRGQPGNAEAPAAIMPDPELALLMLFAVATIVALVVRRLSIPYTAGLVVAGLALGATQAFHAPLLTKELLFTVFLPGLLFEAAFNLDFSQFWHNRIGVFSLALPGVVASIAVTAALLTPAADALHFIQGFRFIDGLIFAARRHGEDQREEHDGGAVVEEALPLHEHPESARLSRS